MTDRKGGRAPDELRPIDINYDFQPGADASLLLKTGNTHVLCAATVEEGVPPFLKGTGQGWITAEYGMLPCSTNTRLKREAAGGRSGRTYEIQRLIGRSLRMMVDLFSLGELTIRVDCDVLNADGGTRTNAITGGALVVRSVLQRCLERGLLQKEVEILPVAAVSAGLVDGRALLDLDYGEDSRAEADGNFVMTGDRRLIEIQTTAEARPVSREEFAEISRLAEKGIRDLLFLW
ncbi:MAG: ribonuclease PH [Desulfurivibrionaceae bacterium]